MSKKSMGKEAGHEQQQARRRRARGREGPVAQHEKPDLLAVQRAVARPDLASPADILALQQSYGNQAVQRLLVGNRVIQRITEDKSSGSSIKMDKWCLRQLNKGEQIETGAISSCVGLILYSGNYVVLAHFGALSTDQNWEGDIVNGVTQIMMKMSNTHKEGWRGLVWTGKPEPSEKAAKKDVSEQRIKKIIGILGPAVQRRGPADGVVITMGDKGPTFEFSPSFFKQPSIGGRTSFS